MSLKLITAPSGEPVNLADVKAHIRGIAGTHEDDYLRGLIASSRQATEKFLHRALLNQTWDLFLDRIPAKTFIEIPLTPLSSVTVINTYNTQDTAAVFASTNYFVDTNSEPGRVSLNDGILWPSTTLRPINGFQITFISGYGTNKTDIPEVIRRSMLLMVAGEYHNRQNDKKNTGQGMIDSAFNMIMPYKVFR